MKIEEVIKIYDFLGKLNLLNFIGVTLLILVALLSILLPLREKAVITWKLLFLIEGLVLFGLIILYGEAIRRSKFLPLANAIKTNLIYSGYYQKSFNQIQAITYLKGDTNEVIKALKQLPELYPTDFLFINMWSPKSNSLDTFGLRVVDPNAIQEIQKKIDSEAERTSLLIRAYMKSQPVDTITLETVRMINNQAWLIGQDFFKSLIGRHHLVPIYDTSMSYPIGGYNVKGFTLAKEDEEKE